MYKGKKICNFLRSIRKRIADANGISYETEECHYQGDCLGTCPKCEAETRYVENQLRLRQKSGFSIKIAGVAATIVSSTALQSCNFFSSPAGPVERQTECVLTGDTIVIPKGDAELLEDIPAPEHLEPLEPPKLGIVMGFVSRNDSDSIVVKDSFIPKTEKEKQKVIQFLSELYGLNEYQGFMFSDLDFLLPHCTERLLQKLQADFGGAEDGYATNDFRTPATDGNGINVLVSIDYKVGYTYVVRYIDLGHEAVTEIDAYVVSDKVLMDDVRLIEWNEYELKDD